MENNFFCYRNIYPKDLPFSKFEAALPSAPAAANAAIFANLLGKMNPSGTTSVLPSLPQSQRMDGWLSVPYNCATPYSTTSN